MVKRKLVGKGFKAVTLEGRKGFNPVFDGVRNLNTRLFRKGFHQTVEAWMVDHPSERIPKAEFAKRFGYQSINIQHITKKIEAHHGLPERRRGGPNAAISKPIQRVIEQVYMKTRKGRTIKLWDIIREIAMQTGKVVSTIPIRRIIETMELKHKKEIKINYTGANRSIDQSIILLRKEGIEAERFQNSVAPMRW